MKTLKILYRITFIAMLVLSCTKTDPVRDTSIDDMQIEFAQDLQLPTIRYEGIGLRLHTMIEWTDAANTLWRRVNFGCYNDIIIEMSDFNELGYVQYLIFDYVQKKVVDIIAADYSSSILLFYKSYLPNVLLMENYHAKDHARWHRYKKYVYGEGVSVIKETEFMDLFSGEYISEAPRSEAYIVNYKIRNSVTSPGVRFYFIDKSRLPEAWPDGLNADDGLFNRLNARVFNSDPSGWADRRGYSWGCLTRATDWKVWDNKYVFMLNSDPNSNPYGHRAYYVVRTLDGKLIFTVPRIMAPALKDGSGPLFPLHDTLIDFSADQKRVLIKGMINNKLCIMIYDIVTYEEWTLTNNTTAVRLTLGADFISPLETSESISADQYNIEPGTTTLYGVVGRIADVIPLHEKPVEGSNIIMQLNYDNMDKYKHIYKPEIGRDELLCFEILDRTKTKTTVNGAEDYWYQIIFDSAVNWEQPYLDRFAFFKPEIFTEYSGWVFGNNFKILDTINENVIILSGLFVE